MVYGAHFLFTSRSIARVDHIYLIQNWKGWGFIFILRDFYFAYCLIASTILSAFQWTLTMERLLTA